MDSGTGGKRTLPEFREIVLDGFGSVHITQDTETTLGLDGAGDHDFPMDSNVRDGVLYLDSGIGSGKVIIRSHPPVFRITTPQLERISIKGVARAKIVGFSGKELKVLVDGAGGIQLLEVGLGHLHVRIGGAATVSATGTADLQEIEITGAGSFTGEDLLGRHAEVNINGAGKAKINASEALKISIGGVGSVTYLGNPMVEQRVGGLGRVKRA